jgi:hypothetical protein
MTRRSTDELWVALADSIERMSNLLNTQKAIAAGTIGPKGFDNRLAKMVEAIKTMQRERNRYEKIWADLKKRAEAR